jgi:hypothetical protein
VSAFDAGKSLGLGSRVSQISAIYCPGTLDRFIKEKLRIKCYGCYMDDLYLIHAYKTYLQHRFVEIKKICAALQSEIEASPRSRKQHRNAEVVYSNPEMSGT